MKQNTKIILIIIMSIFLAVILTVQNTSKNNIQSDTIKRPNYKEGSQSLELDVYTQGNDKPSTIEFEVSPRQYTKDEAMAEVQMVVEGVYAAKAAHKLAEKYNVEMPIVEQVNAVLFDDKKPSEAVKELMLRDKKIELADSDWR